MRVIFFQDGNSHFSNELLIKASPVIMFFLDNDLRYVIGTDLFVKTLSLDNQEEMVGRRIEDLISHTLSDDDLQTFIRHCNAVLNGAGDVRYRGGMLVKTGDIYNILVDISQAAGDDGTRCGIIVVAHYIAQLAEAIEFTQTADMTKSSILANMGHEIRTPMNAIKGMSDLLLLTRLDDKQRGYAQNIINAAVSLLAIIDDMLDFSKIQSHTLDLVQAPCDVASLFTDIASLVNLKASEKDIAFLSRIDPSIPASVVCDEARLKQVLQNIMNNAVKFTAAGYIRFSARCKHLGENRVKLFFEIEDTGRGISDEDLPKIFEPFSRMGQHKNRGVEGLGLSLSISSKLVRKMGGDLSVSSVPGIGTSFSFSIECEVTAMQPLARLANPSSYRFLILADDMHGEEYCDMLRDLKAYCDLCRSEEEFAASLAGNSYTHLIYRYNFGHKIVTRHSAALKDCSIFAVKNIRSASRQNTSANIGVIFEPMLVMSVPRLRGWASALSESVSDAGETSPGGVGAVLFEDAKVLLVDDNEINLIVCSELLKQYAITPDTANSAKAAFELTSKKQYDIIFMDHMMPETDGIEAAKILRAGGGWLADVPIVALTANALPGIKETYLTAGMSDYISKPIEIDELTRVLRQWLPESRIAQAPTSQKRGEARDGASENLLMKKLSERLDTQSAMRGIGGSEKSYRHVIETFLATLPGEISKMLDCVRETKFDRFRIEVHASKSSLANIGASELSAEAQKLETAVKEQDYSCVVKHHGIFLGRLVELGEFLKETISGVEEDLDKHKAPGDAAILRASLERIKSLTKDLEYDGASEEIDKILEESYGSELDRILLQIKASLEAFSYDAMIHNIEKILRSGEAQEDGNESA